jgi:hypothetical protein
MCWLQDGEVVQLFLDSLSFMTISFDKSMKQKRLPKQKFWKAYFLIKKDNTSDC